MQRSNLHYVIEFDIKGFFDNVDHSKLIKQIWAMGIRGTHLIWIIKRILKAPIKMPDGSLVTPTKGTPQGGLCSPLLANIVLNELDHWIESQWQNNPVTKKYSAKTNPNGSKDNGNGFKVIKKTNLKEMFIVRYADDFRIFCRTKSEAERTKIAVTQWLSERLKLEVSEKKTRIVNVKRRYSEFLGFKIKVYPKGQKYVVKSHICDKAINHQRQKLTEQAKRIARPSGGRKDRDEITLYNSMIMGMHNYYCIATHVSVDCAKLAYSVKIVLHNRLKTRNGNSMSKTGRALTKAERKQYGASKQLRYVHDEPIYLLGFVQRKVPMAKKLQVCSFTPEGRKELHDNLRINVPLMLLVMKQPLYGRSVEYADNRISLFSAQWGKCAVTGQAFECVEDIHCHQKFPKSKGGTDKYNNLILVFAPIHRLIHATTKETISTDLKALNLKESQLAKVNKLRKLAELEPIDSYYLTNI